MLRFSRFSPSLVALLAIALLAGAAAVALAGGHDGGSGKSGRHAIVLVEHASTDVTTDTGAAGDSVGDVLTFANEVFDAADAVKAGTDQGYCIRVVAGASYECNWTTILPGGQIVVEAFKCAAGTLPPKYLPGSCK